MKKLVNIVFACLLAIMLSVSVFAAPDAVHISNVEALPGETVYLTVSVTQSIKGRSMGIKYSFDEKVLKVLPNACSWEVNGMIKDFSQKDHNGVWAAGEAVDLRGEVCVLAFEVLPKAKLTQTAVECTLVIEDESKTEYNVTATVSSRCDHQYGPWSGKTGELHSRECTLCGKTESQSHSWDDGEEIVKDGKRLQVFTCSVCKAKNEIVLGETGKTTESTKPHDEDEHLAEKPTAPQKEEQHEHQEQQEDMIGVPVDTDKGRIEFAPTETAGEEHSHQEDTSEEQTPTEHTHTHAEETVGSPSGLTAVIVIGVCVVLIGGAVLYLKKKK